MIYNATKRQSLLFQAQNEQRLSGRRTTTSFFYYFILLSPHKSNFIQSKYLTEKNIETLIIPNVIDDREALITNFKFDVVLKVLRLRRHHRGPFTPMSKYLRVRPPTDGADAECKLRFPLKASEQTHVTSNTYTLQYLSVRVHYNYIAFTR